MDVCVYLRARVCVCVSIPAYVEAVHMHACVCVRACACENVCPRLILLPLFPLRISCIIYGASHEYAN